MVPMRKHTVLSPDCSSSTHRRPAKKKRKHSFPELPRCRHAQAPFSLGHVLWFSYQLVKKSLIMLKATKKKEGRYKKAQENLPGGFPRAASICAGSPPHNRLAVLLTSQQNNSCSQSALEHPSLADFFWFSFQQEKRKNLPNAPAATTASSSSLANTPSSEASSFPVSVFLLETQKSSLSLLPGWGQSDFSNLLSGWKSGPCAASAALPLL